MRPWGKAYLVLFIAIYAFFLILLWRETAGMSKEDIAYLTRAEFGESDEQRRMSAFLYQGIMWIGFAAVFAGVALLVAWASIPAASSVLRWFRRRG